MSPQARLSSIGILAAALSCGAASAQAPRAGAVIFTTGAVTADNPASGSRIIGKDSEVFAGDTLSTANRGVAIVELADGTKMSLRPGSAFRVEEMRTGDKPQDNSAVLSLLKGGLRAVTGFISKRNPNGYRMNTPVATIGIRGTEFDARLCAADCQKEQQRLLSVQPQLAARVAFLKGQITARDAKGAVRPVPLNGDLFEGDTVDTGTDGIAVLAFRDETRITLQPNTQFKIERHRYAEAEPAQDSSLFRLIKGSLRTLTGLIGKRAPERMKLATPVATIGIRGTGFDLHCEGHCGAEGEKAQDNAPAVSRLLRWFIASAHAQNAQGLYASVWNGQIEFQFKGGGSLLLDQGKALFFASANAAPIELKQLPLFLQNPAGPRPDDKNLPKSGPLPPAQSNNVKPGLYVSVYEGNTQLSDGKGTQSVGAGQSGGSNDEGVVKLTVQPAFQVNDFIPKAANLDTATLNALSNLVNELGGGSGNTFQCTLEPG
jgi:hypothetical protein